MPADPKPDPDDLDPDDEADTVLEEIETPDPTKDPAEEIEERGAPDGIDFA